MTVVHSDTMTDFLVLLCPSDGQKVAKVVTPDEVKPQIQIKYFRAATVGVDSLATLATTLDKVALHGSCYVVRGKVIGDPKRMRRTHLDEPTLEEHAHRWLLIDVDTHEAITDMAERAEHYALETRKKLGFEQSACWWQATGSAGIKPGIRLRLGFWLDRPQDNKQLKTWLGTKPVDLSLYTPSQPHFVAHPIFKGVKDPFEGRARSGVLPGAPELVVPSEYELPGETELAKALRAIRVAPQGEKRNTLNAKAFHLAASTPLSAELIEEKLLPAALENGWPGHEAVSTLRTAIRDGKIKFERERKGWKNELARGKEGEVKSTQANITLYVEHHEAWAGKLAYDERAHRPLWLSPPPWGGPTPRFLDEPDTTHAIEWFQREAKTDAKPAWVRDGFVKASMVKRFDPIQDYLSALPRWDTTERAETIFIRHLGVADTPLTRAQTRVWLLQAVKRAHATIEQPVQADYLVVLSGRQGLRKSSLLRALCPDPRFFRDHLPHLDKADARIAAANSWIVELSELSVHKADRDAFKAYITCMIDQFRRPYGRDEVVCPRRCVLAGTTNEGEFLVDPTGNRRFMPMICTRRADIDEVKAERDQLWAEVKTWAEAGEKAYLSEALETQAAHEQEKHTEENPAVDSLRLALMRPQTILTELDSYPGQLDGERRVLWITAPQAANIARCRLAQARYALHTLGWTRVDHGQVRRYYPPAGWYEDKDKVRHVN